MISDLHCLETINRTCPLSCCTSGAIPHTTHIQTAVLLIDSQPFFNLDLDHEVAEFPPVVTGQHNQERILKISLVCDIIEIF